MRSSTIIIIVVAAVVGGGLAVMRPKTEPTPEPGAAKPPNEAAKVEDKPAEEKKAEDKKTADSKTEDKKTEDTKAVETPTAARKLPLVLKRWSMPRGQKAPDKNEGTSLLVNPTGPWIINQTKTGATYWNATTGEQRRTARVPETEPVITVGLGPDGKTLSQVTDRRDNKKLLGLRETIARVACWTPDGRRLIVVLKPGMYPAYRTINVATGETKEKPPHPVKNIVLYDAVTGDCLGEFSPKEQNLDDDIWAVVPAADGQSFFIASQKELMQINFERAFERRALTPARK